MTRPLSPIALSLALAAWSAAACASPSPGDPPSPPELEPCPEVGVPDALCGTVPVPEDPEAPGGRIIALAVTVLPATGSEAERAPDPIFALHGGPGAAARYLTPIFAGLPARVRRDVVLVDQRGTGGSNGMACGTEDAAEWLVAVLGFDFAPSQCRDFDADPRLYTTPVAMDDLDRVREAMGYEELNLWGGSYGARAALVYARRHPDRVRSMVLDGVAPLDMAVPSEFPRTSQAAMDRVLEDCAADPRCAALGDLEGQLAEILARLEGAPAPVTFPFPGAAEPLTVEIGRAEFAGALLYALYNPATAAFIPGAIAAAHAGNYVPAASLGAGFAAGLRAQFSSGMTLSVLCAEDVPYFTADEMAAGARGTFLGVGFADGLHEACEGWPAGTVPATHRTPLEAEVPTLLLSGEADPVTPPEFGDEVASRLTPSLHVVFPDQGHGQTTTPCGAGLVSAFLEAGSPAGLDASCAAQARRPPFPG